MLKTDCIFCKIVNNEIPSKIIFENDKILAFLDINPISKGHTIVITKNHYSTIESIPEEELSELFLSVKKISILIRKKLKIDGYNILLNNYRAAGQIIDHIHVHIIPRRTDDNLINLEIPKEQATQSELEEVLKLIIKN